MEADRLSRRVLGWSGCGGVVVHGARQGRIRRRLTQSLACLGLGKSVNHQVPTMKVYSLSPQGISKLRRRLVQRLSALLGVPFLVVLGLNWWQAGDNWLTTVIVSVIVFAAVLAIAVSRSLRQVNEVWDSIKVEVGDDYVARSQVRIPQVRIPRDEITAIEEIEGGLCIRTADKWRTLAIPADLDDRDYQEIRSKLSAWRPIRPKSAKARVQNVLLLVVLLVGFGILLISTSLWLVLGVGLVMVGYYGYWYWTMRRVEGIDPQQRRSLLVVFLIPIFIMALKVCVLSGGYDTFLRLLLNIGQAR